MSDGCTQTQFAVSRAEQVRHEFYGPRADTARAAFDSLLADRDRYREALERIAEVPEWWQGKVAQEALNGD